MGPVAERASADLGLLERAEFIDALEESFAAVTGGRGRLVLVSGEAGIGKSALVRGFCGGRGQRTRVLWGACDALGTPRPLSPLIDMAAAVEGAFPASMREGEKPHAVFVALLEELRARPPTIAVIEDVHWADEATLDIVRLLARRAEAWVRSWWSRTARMSSSRDTRCGSRWASSARHRASRSFASRRSRAVPSRSSQSAWRRCRELHARTAGNRSS